METRDMCNFHHVLLNMHKISLLFYQSKNIFAIKPEQTSRHVPKICPAWSCLPSFTIQNLYWASIKLCYLYTCSYSHIHSSSCVRYSPSKYWVICLIPISFRTFMMLFYSRFPSMDKFWYRTDFDFRYKTIRFLSI